MFVASIFLSIDFDHFGALAFLLWLVYPLLLLNWHPICHNRVAHRVLVDVYSDRVVIEFASKRCTSVYARFGRAALHLVLDNWSQDGVCLSSVRFWIRPNVIRAVCELVRFVWVVCLAAEAAEFFLRLSDLVLKGLSKPLDSALLLLQARELDLVLLLLGLRSFPSA